MSVEWFAEGVSVGRHEDVDIRVRVIGTDPVELAGAIHAAVVRRRLIVGEFHVETMPATADTWAVLLVDGGHVFADFDVRRVDVPEPASIVAEQLARPRPRGAWGP